MWIYFIYSVTGSCEEITIPLCKDLPYTSTSMPNTLGHADQDDAGLEVHQFWPLVEIGCSPYLQEFLCIIYAPPCDETIGRVPCRELCEAAREGCEDLMREYGFQWPQSIACESLPSIYFSSVRCNLGSLQLGEKTFYQRENFDLAIRIYILVQRRIHKQPQRLKDIITIKTLCSHFADFCK